MRRSDAVWHTAFLSAERAEAAIMARRHGIPPLMIEAATRYRLSGNWPQACAVAGVDVRIDLHAIRRRQGRTVIRALLADLAHLAPDLLRWHLPRQAHGAGLLRRGLRVPLARYPGGLTLAVLAPPQALRAGERLLLTTLDAQPPGHRHRLDRHRMFWDARQAPLLAGLCARPVAARGITELQDAGSVDAAWAAAGWLLHPPEGRWRSAGARLARFPVDLPRLLAEARGAGSRRCAVLPGGGLAIVLDGLDGLDGTPGARVVPPGRAVGLPLLPEAAWARPMDAELLRLGLVAAADLHPLVAAALQPGAPLPQRRLPATGTVPVEVSCGGTVHRLRLRAGRWHAVDHDPSELARESLLARLGGPPHACAEALRGLTCGAEFTDTVERLLEHGRTEEVLALIRHRLGPDVGPQDVRLPGGVQLSERLAELADAGLRHRLALSGAGPRPATRPTRPNRRPRKGEPARTPR